MTYVVRRTIKGKEELVPVSAYSQDTNTYNTFKGLMASENIGIELHNEGVRFHVISDSVSDVAGEETLVYPVIVPGGSEVIGVDAVDRVYQQNPGFTDYNKIVSFLNSKGANYTLEGIASIFQGIAELTKYSRREEQYVINVSRHFVESLETWNTLTTYNSKRTLSLPFLTSEVNKTNKMQNEFDKLFVKLPKYETLMDTEYTPALIPKEGEIASPYPHMYYLTPHMIYAYDMIPKEREAFLSRCMRGSGFKNDESLPKADVKSIPIIPKKHIIGSATNNTLGIQSNEEEYAEALRQYIKFDISQHFPDKDVDEAYSEGLASGKMIGYLHELIVYFLRQNWTHNNKIEIGGGLLDEDDEDDDDITEDDGNRDPGKDEQLDTARFLYFPYAKEHPLLERADGIRIMKNFVESAIKQVGFEALIEAIIKLARWGDLKPSILVLDGYKRYLDLNTFNIRNTTGNIACLKEIPINGHKYELVKFILQPNQLPDRRYLQEHSYSGMYTVPIGVVLKLHLEEQQYQTVFMSMIDLVNYYLKGGDPNLVDGINIDNGKFYSSIPNSQIDLTVSLPNVIRDVLKDEDSLCKIETSQECKTVELKASSGKGVSVLDSLYYGFSLNGVLSDFAAVVEATSIPEAIDKAASVSQGVDTVIKANVLKTIIPILEDVEKSLQNAELSLASILNSYALSMKNNDFTSEFQFLSEISGGPRRSVMKEEVTQINSFATSQQELVDPKIFMQSQMILAAQPGEIIYSLSTKGVNPNGPLKPVCGVIVRKVEGKPRNTQILVGASKIPSGAQVMKTDGMQIIAAVFASIASIMIVGEGYTKFNSVEDVSEILNTYQSIVKGE